LYARRTRIGSVSQLYADASNDDIMDEADLRRGMPSTHKEFGINAAILSGDAMSILAYQYLLHDCKESNALPALALFNKTAMDICIGQQLDMEFEGRNHLTSEEYIEMITLKTGILGMALQLGAIIGGRVRHKVEHFMITIPTLNRISNPR
jgi:geranylgeranyl diphosphate synthase type II